MDFLHTVLVYHVSALLFLFLMFEWEEGLGGAGNLTDGMADEYFLFFNTRSTCLLLQKLTWNDVSCCQFTKSYTLWLDRFYFKHSRRRSRSFGSQYHICTAVSEKPLMTLQHLSVKNLAFLCQLSMSLFQTGTQLSQKEKDQNSKTKEGRIGS